MDLAIWAGGRLHTPDEPVLTAVDHGVTVGDGVFETCGVHHGTAFALTRHLERLQRSADGLGLPPLPLDEVREGVRAVLAAAGDHAGRLRITKHAELLAGQQQPFTGDRAKQDALAWMDAERGALAAVLRSAVDGGLNREAWQLAEALTALYVCGFVLFLWGTFRMTTATWEMIGSIRRPAEPDPAPRRRASR